MEQNAIKISLIFGLLISNLDTKKISGKSSHWKYRIIPLLELHLINQPQVSKTVVLYDFRFK